MLTVGVTGGIGSGKSLITRVFKSIYNIPVFESDLEAKRIMNSNQLLKDEICQLLGTKSYCESGELNREYIANIVFKDLNKLEQLNQLVHNHVRIAFRGWASKQTSEYVLNEAAIMIESGFYKQLNKVIAVTSQQEIRIKRVLARDNMTREQVLQRMEKQLGDDDRNNFADFIILNNSKESIIDQVSEIHKKILQHG